MGKLMGKDRKANVVEFKGSNPIVDVIDPDPAERALIKATLENVMAAQSRYDQQISTLIALIGEMQAHIRDLEHDVAKLKEKPKAVIYNAAGKRVN